MMRTVELLVAYTDHTWNTICFNLPYDDINFLDDDELVIHILKHNHLDGAIALTTVYNIRDAEAFDGE